MPNTTNKMLTIEQLQKTPAAELRAIALHTQSRMYAMACNQMASAAEAYALSGVVDATVKAHAARAAKALVDANKDEHAQVMSAARKRQQLEADGIKTTCDVVGRIGAVL